jgi:hypothetical protein
MDPLELESEKYSAHGNAASQGILKQLGQPKLDLFSLLIREAVQNSWDARQSDTEPVHFDVIGYTLSGEAVRFLRDIVLTAQPETLGHIHETLLFRDEINALLVSDRGTTGLDGPTRADAPANGKENRNFVNFFRNVGQSKSKHLVGGTYGYGKSVLYRVSQLNTICAHTRCLVNGQLESRFITAALEPQGQQAQSGYSPYTGRHWWGRKRDNVIEPVIGPEADEIATNLGLPPFQNDEMGTTCMILLPNCEDHPFGEILQRITRILLWYFWPKMLPNSQGITPMNFTVKHNTQTLTIPDPTAFPPLQGFVQAMQELKHNTAGNREDFMQQLTEISSQRPKKFLGNLALRRFSREERLDKDIAPEDSFPPVRDVCSHVALMRGTELVVKYLSATPMASSSMEYAGVFIVNEDVDEIFAKAEPPTHDDWNPQSLTDRYEKTYVNVALNKIRDHMEGFATPLQTAGKGESLPALGDFADQLGGLLIGLGGKEDPRDPAEGSGSQSVPPDAFGKEALGGEKKGGDATPPEPQSPPGSLSPSGLQSPPTPQKTPRIVLADDGRLDLVDDTPALLLTFSVNPAVASKATRVEVSSAVVLDNNELECEPPSRGERPEVLQWINADGKTFSGSDAIDIPASDSGQWKVAVSMPVDTLLNVNLIAYKID